MIAKLLTVAALASPLTAAGTATATFHCALGHGGVAVFHVHDGPIAGYGVLHKPSGGRMILHLGAVPCVATGGCIVAAQVGGHKGYKLDKIMEVADFPHLVMHKCR